MVTGGHLVSGAFLAQHLKDSARRPPHDDARPRTIAEWRAGCALLGPASSLRAIIEVGVEPLVRALGFSGIESLHADEEVAVATLVGPPPLVLIVTRWGEALDGSWRTAVVEARRRAADWCVLFNGTHLRLVDGRRAYSRRYIDVDLDLAAADGATADALWTLFAAASFTAAAAGGCAVADLVAASERHGATVCRALRDGVLSASQDVLQALVAGRRHALHESFEQALTIVYRILFLLFAEARALVPVWHPLYRDSYSVDALRAAAERTPAPPGSWDALRAVSRLAHSGCQAGDLHVTAFNGRLFAPSRTPLVERRDLDDTAARRAVLALATSAAADGAGRERIAYRDLGVEQLGAVYETLLDYEPTIAQAPDLKVGPTATRRTPVTKVRPTPAACRPELELRRVAGCRPELELRRVAGCRPELELGRRVTLQRGSGLRKSTGTFYTPQPIAHYLVRRALGPLVDGAAPDRILELKVVDPAMGSGAFLVAACEYLAQAYEHALVRAGGCHPSDLGPAEQAAIRRTIAERCLYGVDLNPMAVQLARLSLWLTTLAADRPLTFLDHHMQCGDSLLGAWLANLRSTPRKARSRRPSRSDTLPLFDTPALGDALRQALPVRFNLATVPDDTVEQVHEKERALASLTRKDAALSRWKRVADLWCAEWFQPESSAPSSAFGALSDAILTGRTALPRPVAERYLRAAESVAAERRFFHWELEFPEVFFDAAGARLAAPGFDAVIGNPPWDMIRADAGSAEDRARTRGDASAVIRFTRDAGVYSAQSDGHANRYQLFLERAIAISRSDGRIGLVLPSGLGADHGSAKLRRLLFSRCAVEAIVGFDNRSGVFPIHRSVRFMLLTATSGRPTTEIACRLGEHNPGVLESGDADMDRAWYPVRVTPAVLERLTGLDVALPELMSPIDLAIAERAASLFPALGDARGWGARFGRELNATDDRGLFEPAGRGLPVVEGKQIEPFRVDAGAARWSIGRRDADRLLGTRHHRSRLAYRDVASATNRLTLIAALLPSGAVSTHTVFCLRTPMPRRSQQFLCGLFNSFVVNYLARLRVTTHVTTGIVERLPIPTADADPAAAREVVLMAAALARRRNKVRLKADPTHTTDVASAFRRTSCLARLNARVAQMYQLTVEEFAHVLSTFPLIPRDERDEALHEFQKRRV